MSYSVRQHHRRVRELGCVLSGRREPTLHHCKGGSMLGLAQKGMSMRTSDWLVIPLDAEFHTGPWGIDSGQPWLTVEAWEAFFYPQTDLIDRVCRATGVDAWKLAGVDRDAR